MRGAAVIGVALLLGGCAAGTTPGEAFDRLKDSPPELRAFLAAMPKGAELHSHLGGAVYAESNLNAGARAGFCLDIATQKIVPPPCVADKAPPLAEVMAGGKAQGLIDRAIDGQSMRNFVPAPGLNAHDQFFATFAKFGDSRDPGLMLAEVLNRAGRQNVVHIELMQSFAGRAVQTLGASVPWTGAFDTQLAALEAKGLANLVPAARTEVDTVLATARAAMACDTPAPQPGCAVSVRFLQQITRTAPPEVVAAQTAFGFWLAAADPRVAGINIVSPEDALVSLRDYRLHMGMIGTMAERFPQVGVALHAGELTLGLVPPEQLRAHIRDAVEIGHARRIGHGVDIMYEDDPHALLRLMAARGVAVEIALTSNDVILGVRGADHPFPVYRRAGVPVALSTDDEGVSRIDLTHEYQRAVREFGLGYADLKTLSRISLEHAFLTGPSLWRDTVRWRLVAACEDGDSPACAAFLAGSDKASRQWALEQAFARFEAAAPYSMSR
jgi:hypothetical protein